MTFILTERRIAAALSEPDRARWLRTFFSPPLNLLIDKLTMRRIFFSFTFFVNRRIYIYFFFNRSGAIKIFKRHILFRSWKFDVRKMNLAVQVAIKIYSSLWKIVCMHFENLMNFVYPRFVRTLFVLTCNCVSSAVLILLMVWRASHCPTIVANPSFFNSH